MAGNWPSAFSDEEHPRSDRIITAPICYLNKAQLTSLTTSKRRFFLFSCYFWSVAVSRERTESFYFCSLSRQFNNKSQANSSRSFFFLIQTRDFPSQTSSCLHKSISGWFRLNILKFSRVVQLRHSSVFCPQNKTHQRIISAVTEAGQWNTSAGWNRQLFILGPSQSWTLVVQSDTLLCYCRLLLLFVFFPLFIVLWMSLMFRGFFLSIYCSCFTTSAMYYICMGKHKAEWIWCHSY